jgi:myotubularin-related protein 1/2
LATHCTSLRFGTFLYNSDKERQKQQVSQKTVSLWSYLNSQCFKNEGSEAAYSSVYYNSFYDPHQYNSVILPCVALKALSFWDSYYLRSHVWMQQKVERLRIPQKMASHWKETALQLAEQKRDLQDEVEKLKKQIAEFEKRK